MNKYRYRIIECLIILIILIASYFVAGSYDLLERLVEFTSKYEKYEVDELITTSLVLVVCLLVFVFRLFKAERKYNQIIGIQNKKLKKAYDEIQVLKGMVPVCSICKKIRDDKGVWHQMEVYIEEKSEVKFSHSLCDNCMNERYPPEED